MRTVRRQVVGLNAGKRESLRAVIKAYAQEKKHWLEVFGQKANRLFIKQHRMVRDAAIKDGYVPKSGLQARMWKLALVDAADLWDRHWEALFERARSKMAKRKDFSDTDRHYANWLLCGYAQAFACLEGSAPKPSFDIDEARLPQIASAVRRAVSKLRGQNPTVSLTRSLTLDANCYSVFTQSGRQWIDLMSLQRGKRIALPLSGSTGISGNLKVILEGDAVEVHIHFDLAPANNDSEVTEAIDLGYSEAFVDTQGAAYGKGLGKILTTASEDRHVKGSARNKLRALAQKLEVSSDPARRQRARNIRRFNLGDQKWVAREARARAAISCEINRGLNQLVKARGMGVLVSEDLGHAFTYDKPPSVNRRLASWTRGIATERIHFKSLAEGFRHEQVNPAYGSQECPKCGFVDSNNRNQDRFACLHCKYQDHADRVGAMNLKSRLTDQQITRYTPYREVKVILMQRFQRRLETEGNSSLNVTVPGRTLDVVVPLRSAPSQKHSGEAKALYPTTTRRAKQQKNVKLHTGTSKDERV